MAVETTGDPGTLKLSGRVRAGDALTLRNVCLEMIEAQSPVITLDLADADSLDSVVLGQLVGIHLTCKRAGARLRLIHVSEDVEDVLAETKLLQILNVEK